MFAHLKTLLQRIPFASVERSRLLSGIQVLIALTFLIAVGVLCLSTINYARSNAAKALVNRGEVVSSIVARTVSQALEQPSNRDTGAALDKIVYDMRAEEGLEFMFIVDRNNRAIAHSHALKKDKTLALGLPLAEEAEARKAGAHDGFYCVTHAAASPHCEVQAGTTLYQFVRPIPLSAKTAETYGGGLELHMGFQLPGFWSFAGASLKRIAPGLAIAFFLLIVGNYLAGVLVRPIKALEHETALAAKAEDDWQLTVEATGEIADIARNWNDMVANFQSSYQHVVEARRELEVRNRVMLYEKKRTEAIVDSLSDGVMVTDAYGKISFVNRECESLLEIERVGVLNRKPQDAAKDESIAQFLASAAAGKDGNGRGPAAPPKKSQRRVEDLEVKRKNGTRHIRASHVPVLDSNGKPGGAITTFRDTTQEKLEEQARKEFVSNVTHELRAPLTAIKSYVEMLIDDEAKDPALQHDFFNTINEEADRLARLIDDMLNMSKIEVGNLVLNKSVVRTQKLIEDAVNGLRSAAKSKSIELSADVAADLPDIEADKEMVRVVVTNLLCNGVKYTQEGGRVFLTAELIQDASSQDGGGTIAMTIADNGPGIPEDELDKIFEKFYRARNTAKQKVMGNGLGLALAREIATLHGGDIKVSSTIGEGSKFTFLLPAAKTSRKVS